MKSEVLVNFPYMWMMTLAFGLFVFVFIGMIYFTMRKSNKQYFSNCAEIPLREEGEVK